jgi:hypothetical protein
MATPHLLPEHDLWEAYGYQASVRIDRNFRLTGDGISHGDGRCTRDRKRANFADGHASCRERRAGLRLAPQPAPGLRRQGHGVREGHEAFAEGVLSTANARVATAREKFEALNSFVTERGGGITSLPGDRVIGIECLPDATLPDDLRNAGYKVIPAADGERIIAGTIIESFVRRADGGARIADIRLDEASGRGRQPCGALIQDCRNCCAVVDMTCAPLAPLNAYRR